MDLTQLQNHGSRTCPFCDREINGAAVNGMHKACDQQFQLELAESERKEVAA